MINTMAELMSVFIGQFNIMIEFFNNIKIAILALVGI